MYEILVPPEVRQSEDCLVGNVDKFIELLESGFYAEQYDRLSKAAVDSVMGTASANSTSDISPSV